MAIMEDGENMLGVVLKENTEGYKIKGILMNDGIGSSFIAEDWSPRIGNRLYASKNAYFTDWASMWSLIASVISQQGFPMLQLQDMIDRYIRDPVVFPYSESGARSSQKARKRQSGYESGEAVRDRAKRKPS